MYLYKTNIFDIIITINNILADLQPNPPVTKSSEDNYIAVTSLSPSFVLNSDQSKLLGVSIETAIMNVLKEIEVNQHVDLLVNFKINLIFRVTINYISIV